MPSEPIAFTVTIPDIQSAVTLGGYGARVKLDIPETDVEAFLRLRKLARDRVIQLVAVVVEE